MSDASSLDRRALGRRLSMLANARVEECLRIADETDAFRVPRIGLTGAPGVGKSTLAARLALIRTRTRRIGVLAIDPSSPISGGAILGDRIRLDEMAQNADLPSRIYMRSLASRTAADGLADNLPELLQAMAAAGFEELLLETVGVGQVEHAVRSQVDTLVLVLMPGSGDAVQAMKAGMMELADIFVVNKSELDGAALTVAEIKRVQQISGGGSSGWLPPVLLTSMREPASVEVLSDVIDKHRAWLAESPLAHARIIERGRQRLKMLLERRVTEMVAHFDQEFLAQPLSVQFEHATAQLGEVVATHVRSVADT